MARPELQESVALPPITPPVNTGTGVGDGDGFDPQVVEIGSQIRRLPLKLIQQLFKYMEQA